MEQCEHCLFMVPPLNARVPLIQCVLSRSQNEVNHVIIECLQGTFYLNIMF